VNALQNPRWHTRIAVQGVTERSCMFAQMVDYRYSDESFLMGLFKPDFFRSLAFGFLMGAAVMAVTSGTTALATPDTEQVSN